MKNNIFVWAPNFNQNDGISTFSRELVSGLEDIKGDKIDIFKYDTEIVSNKYIKNSLLKKINQSRVFNKLSFSFFLFLAALIKRPNLIIVTHAHYASLAYIVKKLLSIPYIVVAHGIEIIPTMTLSKLTKFRIKSLKEANTIWSVSEWTKSHLIKLNIEEGKIKILPNTFDSYQFNIGEKKDYLLKRYSIKPNEKIILTVSRIDKREGYKGHEKMLESLPKVIESVGSVKYLIVGRNNNEDNISLLIKKYKLENQVILCGFVPDKELTDHYNISNMFAMPSYGEGFGIVFLESLSCGIPVLGGNKDGTFTTLLEGKLGKLVDPNNTNEITSAIISTLCEKTNREHLREMCIKEYGKESFKKKLFNLTKYYLNI